MGYQRHLFLRYARATDIAGLCVFLTLLKPWSCEFTSNLLPYNHLNYQKE
jgi:hypothetical protein